MRKVWNSAGDDSFAETNIENLSGELLEKVREAEEEWAKIDRDLLKWLGTLGTVAAPFVAGGSAAILPAATAAVMGGAVALGVAAHHRTSVDRRFPASFLLKLKKEQAKE